MELLLLQALQWKLRSITTISFVDLVLSEANMCEKLRQMVLAKASTLVLRTMSGNFTDCNHPRDFYVVPNEIIYALNEHGYKKEQTFMSDGACH